MAETWEMSENEKERPREATLKTHLANKHHGVEARDRLLLC
jgi:hypothetical protein